MLDFEDLFPDSYLFLGADEPQFKCLNNNQNITKFMNQNNLTTDNDLINYFLNRTRYLLDEVNPNKTALYWSNDQTLYMKYRETDIVLYWDDLVNIHHVREVYPNHKKVMAIGERYYLDCGGGTPFGTTVDCEPINTWLKIY